MLMLFRCRFRLLICKHRLTLPLIFRRSRSDHGLFCGKLLAFVIELPPCCLVRFGLRFGLHPGFRFGRGTGLGEMLSLGVQFLPFLGKTLTLLLELSTEFSEELVGVSGN